MQTTIQLPLWFVIIASILAIAGLVDRLLLPTMRWMLRARVSRTIDELNSRLKMRIQPFKLTRREGLIDRIIFDKELLGYIESHALETKEPRSQILERVKQYAHEIVPDFSATTYFKIGTTGAKYFSNALYNLRLDYTDDEHLRNIDPDATVVFVINHRSNMDYVLVTYLASTSSALSYAVGEWAQVFGLRTLIKSMGAYFIRRDSKDPLYRKVLGRYVNIATSEGVTQAVFPEGSLTRDGVLKPAKLGLLSYIIGKFNPDGERDVVFIPVGINYDRVIEDRNLTRTIAKEKGLGLRTKGFIKITRYLAKAFIGRLNGNFTRFGYASVVFGNPLSMREYCAKNALSLRKLDEQQRFLEVEKIGERLMERIGEAIPVLPVALIASVFMKSESSELTMIDIKAKTMQLVDELEIKQVQIHIPRQDLDNAIDDALAMLTKRRLIICEQGEYEIAENEGHIIAYYANSIKHHFGGELYV